MQKVIESLAATAEVMGQNLSPMALSVMAEDLANYIPDDVISALKIVRAEHTRLSLKSILDSLEKICPDGRPGAEEAWALIPKDEYSSTVMTQEMADAWGIAWDLIKDGDQVAGRMAFKEAYNRIVAENKRNGVGIKWTPTLGMDVEGRDLALADAVERGRLTAKHAASLVSPERAETILAIANVPNEKILEIGYKPMSDEEKQANLAKLKSALNGLTFMRSIEPKR